MPEVITVQKLKLETTDKHTSEEGRKEGMKINPQRSTLYRVRDINGRISQGKGPNASSIYFTTVQYNTIVRSIIIFETVMEE